MSYYLPHFTRTINDLIIEEILNQYVPIVKTITSTILTSLGKYGNDINTACGKNWTD